MIQRETKKDEGLSTYRKRLRSIVRSISPGRCLKLREGVHKQLREREWFFKRVENDFVFLIHESMAYGIAVRINDIDWNSVDQR